MVASGVLFAVSCELPAVVAYNTGTREMESMWGLSMLTDGWMGPVANLWGWFANPMLLVSLPLLAVGRYRGAFWVGIAAVIIGLSTRSRSISSWRTRLRSPESSARSCIVRRKGERGRTRGATPPSSSGSAEWISSSSRWPAPLARKPRQR